jgi:hypothetical protein
MAGADMGRGFFAPSERKTTEIKTQDARRMVRRDGGLSDGLGRSRYLAGSARGFGLTAARRFG